MKYIKLIPVIVLMCYSSMAQMTFVSSPLPNENDITILQPIQLDFDTDIDIATVHNNTTANNQVFDDNITVHGEQSGQLQGNYVFGGDNSIIIFTPSTGYLAGEKITVTVTDLVNGTGGEIADARSFSFIGAAGPFEGTFKEFSSSVLGIGWGTVDWGDYDNDGDLDLATVGWDPAYNYTATIYNNSGGVLTNIGATLAGVANSSCDWGDYDGDGDLDLLLAGLDDGGAFITKLYQNNAGTFIDTGETFQGVDYASVAWGDYDNDGDLDAVVMGKYDIGFNEFTTTIIYQNNAGSFSDIGASLTGLSNGSADWVDYDNDGDLDLFLTGFDANWINRFAILYQNNAGVFIETVTSLPGVGYSAADWGDYDNDGDLDLVMMGGQTGPNSGAYIYQNNAGVFTDIGAGFSNAFEDGSARWGDYDGDGDLDLLMVGQDNDLVNDYTAWVYRNDAGVFTDINAGLVGVAGLAKGEWGDFDGDGDLDFLIIGEDNKDFLNSARIYENTVFNAFVTTWKTDNDGDSSDDQITIPTTGAGYNYNIYWEEVGNPTNNGTEPAGQTGNYTITFPSPGTYRVEITGAFPRIYFNAASFLPDKDSEKLLTVEQWGDIAWTSMQSAFSGCVNLQINASDSPNLSGVTDMYRMFYEATSLNANLNNWDVSNVTIMSELFRDADSFDQPLNTWDVSNVIDMSYMFFSANAFNQDISSWDVSSVVTMRLMLASAVLFNQDIGSWNMSNVTNTNQMFAGCTSFNQDITGWDMSNVSDFQSMFNNAVAFNQNIGLWSISSATRMSGMFSGATSFNQDLSGWDVSGVTEMSALFSGATAFDQDLSGWNVSNVREMRAMFANTTYNRDITGWNVGLVQDFNGMFQGNTAFSQDISVWDVSSADDMRQMFGGATAFNHDLGGWNITNLRFAVNMLNGSGMSIENYDNTLIGWASQPLRSNVSFGANGLFYCAGATARAFLISNFNWFISDAGSGCISVYFSPDLSGPEIFDAQANPVNLGSAAVLVGKTRSFTIANNLAVDITNLSITISGTEFVIPATVNNILPGGTLTFDVNVTGSAVGSYLETVTILADNFTDPFTYEVVAEVTATPQPEIEVFHGISVTDPQIFDDDPFGMYMGEVERGTDLVDYFLITNIGSADLDISDLTTLDAAFSFDAVPPLTIPVDGSQLVEVTLDGSLGLYYEDTIAITNTDTDETLFEFPIVGNIRGPEVGVFNGPNLFIEPIFHNQATPVNLGSSVPGTDLIAQITITNLGPVDLDITTLNITGTAFTVNPLPPITLIGELDGVYDEWLLDITLDGSTQGVFTETITINSDDDNTPVFTFDITASIVAPPHIYWTENIGAVTGDDEIHRTDLDGNNFSRYYSGFSDEISGLVIDTTGNKLYWTDAAKARIFTGEIGPDGFAFGRSLVTDFNASSTSALVDLALDLANGHIYYTHGDSEFGFANKIGRVNIDGTNPVELIDLGPDEKPFGIDLDLTNNKIYFTTNLTASDQDSRLYRANLDGTNLEELVYRSTALSTPSYFRDVEVDLSNGLVFWAIGEEDLPGEIYYNSITEAAPYAAPSSFTTTGEVRGLDLDPLNSKLYWMCRGANAGAIPAAIMRSDLDGANKESVFTVTIYPTSYPAVPAGSAFIALDLRGVTAALCATPVTANAGLDLSIDEGNTATLAGTIGGGASSLTWTTSGDGSFDDDTSPTAVYTPGTSDITNGNVTLTLTTDDPDGGGPCLAASDDLMLTINPASTNTFNLFAGSDNSGEPISVGQSDVDLGSTIIGVDLNRDFTIENNQASAVNISAITSSDPAFVVLSVPATIPPGSSELFNVRLVATDVGNFSSGISIISDFAPFNFSIIGVVTATEPGAITVYNAVSPNNDGKHDYLELEGIELFSANRVIIMNRWGDVVYEASGYNNSNVRFEGLSNNGSELPPGTYYYQIDLGDGSGAQRGFISLRK